MDQKKGFTLTEILVAVMILAILAAVAIPGFTKSKTHAASRQAADYLRTIRSAQKMYYARWGNYLAGANFAAIKADLGAESQAKDYDFSVTVPTATTFIATARKKTVPADTISLNESGNFSTTGSETAPPN